MKNPRSEYVPSPLNIAKLEHNEKHIYSFLVGECEKLLFGYRGKLLQYDCHFTDQRLILENHPMPGWFGLAVKSVLFFVDAPPGVEAQIKFDMMRDKIEAGSKSGQYFVLPYSSIERFEVARVVGIPAFARIVLKNPPKEIGKDGIVFSVGVVSKRQVKTQITNRASDFVELGNELLAIFN